MKKIILIISIIAITVITFFACTERNPTHPLDRDYWDGKEVANIATFTHDPFRIDSVMLSWSAPVGNPDGYKYRLDKQTGTGEWHINYKTFSQAETKFTDFAEINQIISYRMYVYFDENISAENVKSYTNTFPAPTNLNVTQTSITSSNISWTDNSKGEDRYVILRKLATSSVYDSVGVVTGSDNPTTKSWTDPNLTPNLTYNYDVRAVKGKYKSVDVPKSYTNTFPAPENLNVTQISITSASISWTDNSKGEDRFEIERKLSTATTYAKIGETTGDLDIGAKQYNDTTLEPGKTYDYQIKAVKGTISSAYVIKTGYLNTFSAPSGLSVTQNNVYTFSLTWSDLNTGEDGFKIERKIDDSAWSEIKNTTATAFVDSTVAKKGFGTIYYQVMAYKGTTYFTGYATANSAVSFPAPTNLIYSKENIYTIKLNWQQTSNGEDGFKIDKKIGTANWNVGYATVGKNVVTWTNTTAEINQTLEYRVYAYKGTNTTDSITTTAIVNTFPAPTVLSATQTSITSATISWTDNSKGEDRFEIERKLSTATTYAKIGETTGDLDIGAKQYNDTTLEPGKTYDYQIKAVKGTISSAYVIKTGYETLPAPTVLTASVTSETSIKFDWTDNSIGEEGFKIDRKVGVAGSWDIGYATVGANIKTFTDSGLTTGTNYYYRVRAYYSIYFSSYTSEVNAIPAAPTGFISIPTGSFSMGQTGVAEPVHTVNITRDYYLGKYEVTQKEWQTTMGSNPANSFGVGNNYPVYYVSWYSILVYCNKRSIAEGLTPCYTISGSTDPGDWSSVPISSNVTWNAVTCNFSAKGYRLPTEAEWEYSARYNDGKTYPWGITSPTSSFCNYNSNVGATTAVGSYPSGNSNLGLCDMAGNVNEWVWDWYATYPSTTQTDSSGPTTAQTYRVLRGGHFKDNSMLCAYRHSYVPSFSGANYTYGFRLARTK